MTKDEIAAVRQEVALVQRHLGLPGTTDDQARAAASIVAKAIPHETARHVVLNAKRPK